MLINDLKKRKEKKVSTNDDHDNFMNQERISRTRN